jgi:hypothetical protein
MTAPNNKEMANNIIKGGVLAVCLFALWGAFTKQNDEMRAEAKQREDKLSIRIDLLEVKITDCSKAYQDVMLNQIQKNNEHLERVEQIMRTKRRY